MKKINIFFYFILIILLIQRIPLIISQFQNEGNILKITQIQDENLKEISFPLKHSKSVIIFWATWCAPCSLELNRIHTAIINKEIDSKFIYAVNLGENPEDVKRVLWKKKYSFRNYFDPHENLIGQLNIKVTPTVAFINEKQEVVWLSSGISPSLIFRIKTFLTGD